MGYPKFEMKITLTLKKIALSSAFDIVIIILNFDLVAIVWSWLDESSCCEVWGGLLGSLSEVWSVASE